LIEQHVKNIVWQILVRVLSAHLTYFSNLDSHKLFTWIWGQFKTVLNLVRFNGKATSNFYKTAFVRYQGTVYHLFVSKKNLEIENQVFIQRKALRTW